MTIQQCEGSVYHSREAWWQACEAVGHMTSAGRKQREVNAGTWIDLSFLFGFSPGNGFAHFSVGSSLIN